MNFRRLLVVGASGMLGNAVLRYFSNNTEFEVTGTVRTSSMARQLQELAPNAHFILGLNVENPDSLSALFLQAKPTVVVNCVGIVKQLAAADDPLVSIPINSLLPHRLAHLAGLCGARLVHLSTDCVFSGRKGMYVEDDQPDAYDLYGRSKLLGEVDYPHAITLRTSIIGHELQGNRSLVSWFLSQNQKVKGFRKAIYSGLPTVEIARIIHEHVLSKPTLHGLYHLSSEPIDKYSLLKLVASAYGKQITINPDESVVIDRSLDSTRFRAATGFTPQSWNNLVIQMRNFG